MERNEETKKDLPLPHPKQLQILTTCAVLIGNITFGCAFNFFSPALEAFRIKYDTETEDISKVFTIFLVMYCIGGLTSGIVYNFINRQLGVIICLSGMALGLYVTPHLPTQTMFFCIGGFIGFFGGCYDCAQVVWIIEIWQSKSGPFIQAQHFCYALGSNIPSLLIGPFLSKTIKDDDDEDSITTTSSSTTVAEEPEESNIYIPFTIAGILLTLSCSFQIFLFIFFRYYKPPLEEELSEAKSDDITLDNNNTISEKKLAESNASFDMYMNSNTELQEIEEKKPEFNWLKAKIIVCTVMFLGFYQGMEMCSMNFIPTFGQKSDLRMSESDSAFVLTGLTAAFAVGRFIGIFLILKVKPQFMLCVNLSLCIIGNVIILIWANDNLTMWWTGCIILGAGLSTTFPSFCAYIERHLLFDNAVGSACIVIGSGTAAIYPLIVGKAIEENAVVLTYTNFFSITCCLIALSCASFLTYGNKKRIM